MPLDTPMAADKDIESKDPSSAEIGVSNNASTFGDP